MAATRLPVWFIPHGGGPCFFMDPPPSAPETWTGMASYLSGIPATIDQRPRALLIISAHWLEARPTVTAVAQPSLIYDYRGFPPHTYQLRYPAPGDPALAADVCRLLGRAGIDSAADETRGFDHGVFVPLLLLYPDADIATVQLSLSASLDPAQHIAIGRALAPLRDEGVLIIGSGLSFHNLQNMFRADPRVVQIAEKFDAWLTGAIARPAPERTAALTAWAAAPGARVSHPYEDHLLPLMVAAGAAADDLGTRDYSDHIFGAPVSGYRFG